MRRRLLCRRAGQLAAYARLAGSLTTRRDSELASCESAVFQSDSSHRDFPAHTKPFRMARIDSFDSVDLGRDCGPRNAKYRWQDSKPPLAVAQDRKTSC